MTADYILQGLTGGGHNIDTTADGVDGLAMALRGNYDVIVLDRMLPGMDGLSVLKAMRAAEMTSPVLFLTAIGGVDDRVEGLEAGADDYLVKPFAFSELAARVAALGRRPAAITEQTHLVVHDLDMDLVRHTVTRSGQTPELVPREGAALLAPMAITIIAGLPFGAPLVLIAAPIMHCAMAHNK